MKLTIDTQVDTHDDIRKVLHILASLLERKDNTSLTDTTNLMGMFSDDTKGTVETQGNAYDFNSGQNGPNLAVQKTEKKDDSEPRIEYY